MSTEASEAEWGGGGEEWVRDVVRSRLRPAKSEPRTCPDSANEMLVEECALRKQLTLERAVAASLGLPCFVFLGRSFPPPPIAAVLHHVSRHQREREQESGAGFSLSQPN
ncbi:hypothetical protein MRX96_049674 [Rhipicephalus microplus]